VRVAETAFSMEVEVQNLVAAPDSHGNAAAGMGFHSGGSVDDRRRREEQTWLQQQAPVDMVAVNAEAAQVAAREQRLAFDFMNAMGSLGLQEGVASTVGRGWSFHVTEDGQVYAHNSFTGLSTWQAPAAQHCL